MLSIRDRPFPPEDRCEAGHWEGDLIVGRGNESAIATLVERQTRVIRLVHLPARDADALHAALTGRMRDLPPALLRSITWDQGTEMARHRRITRDLGTPVYFCDPHSPWQRGSNENSNGLLRQLVADLVPGGGDRGGVRLSEDGAEHRGDHVRVRLGDQGEQVAAKWTRQR